MNKLINRISPETSENRILHAGFSIILMSEEITQTLSGLSSDMIIFILSGSITIYSTKEEKKTIGEQYMIFLRSFENYTYDITLGSKIIIFFFDSLTMNELPYYQHPYGILPQPISKWIELKIVEPLYGFLELVGQYLENNFLNYPLYELKRTELFYLLKKLYRKEELDYFFYLSSTHSAEFERLIAENYIKAKTVTDLAQMIGYGVNSFRMKFKKVFGIPAYECKSRKTKCDGREKRNVIFEAKTKCAQKSRLLPLSSQNTSVVQTPFESCLNDAFLLNFLLKYHLKPIANLAKNRIFT